MFRNVPRSSYRSGQKQVQAWFSLALHAQVRVRAEVEGLSMGDWLVEAAREKVMRDADGGVGSRRGVSVAADERGFGGQPGVAGGVSAGVGPRGADDPVDPFVGLTGADRLAQIVAESQKPSTMGNTVLQPESDPLEDIA